MKIEWVSPVNHKDIIGNSLGYGLANKNLKDSLGKLVDFDYDAETAVHFSTPQFYFRIPGKKNYLFTMCEHTYLTPDYERCFNRCDAVITPSHFCKDVFSQYTDKPIYVCPLGVDTKTWTPKKRVIKHNEPFRILYCGAPNLRKFSIMEDVWKMFLRDFKNVELYIKTTGADIPSELGAIVRSNNWIIDNRKLSTKELVKIFHSSHALLFLHLGEGWGLTAHEAMATQMPVIISDHTGSTDFCNRTNSFPVKVNPGSIEVVIGNGGNVTTKTIDAGVPNIISALTQLATVMYSYERASDVARQGMKDARKLSWDNSARRLKEILDELAV